MPPPKFLTRNALVGFGPRLLPPGLLPPGLLPPRLLLPRLSPPRLPPPQIGSGRVDGAGRLDWFWQNGLGRARWIAGSGLVLAERIDSGKVDGDCVPIDPGSHFLAGDHQIRRSPLVSMCGLLLAPPAFPSPSTPPAMSIQPCLHVQGHCECPAASAQESPVACL